MLKKSIDVPTRVSPLDGRVTSANLPCPPACSASLPGTCSPERVWLRRNVARRVPDRRARAELLMLVPIWIGAAAVVLVAMAELAGVE